MKTPKNNTKLILIPQSFLFILCVYFLSILLMASLRLLFLLSNTDLIQDNSISEILTAFILGWRFDQIIILYYLAPLILLLPWFKLTSKIVQIISNIYLTAIISFCAFALLADIRFYSIFSTRLNFLAVEYMNQTTMFWNLVSSDPMFWPFILLTIAVMVCLYFLIRMIFTLTIRNTQPGNYWSRIVFLVGFVLLSVWGIRGRLTTSPIDWGLAYYSDNQFLNQLALNGVYTLSRNLYEKDGDPRLSNKLEKDRFPYLPLDQGIAEVKQLLAFDSTAWLEPVSLKRTNYQPSASFGFKPNIMFVIMESWSGRNTGCLGDDKNLTPHFDTLASHGLLFTDFYASGIRSSFGLAAILCSYPSLPGRSIMKRFDACHPFVSLPEILHKRDYYNTFIYGGDIAFDNMQGFFATKGIDRFYGQDSFTSDLYFSKWGVPDHILFQRINAINDSLPRPFFTTVFTLSNHEPWDLPDSSVVRFSPGEDSSSIYNAQLYADKAIGSFIDEAKTKPWFDSTIFVFTSDHTRIIPYPKYIIDPENFHIPLLIYSPALLGDTAVLIDRCGSQTDIIPTVMDLLGGDYTHSSWGRNLLTEDTSYTGFAIMNITDYVGIINKDYLYEEAPGRFIRFHNREALHTDNEHPIDTLSESYRELQRQMRVYLQVADQLSLREVE